MAASRLSSRLSSQKPGVIMQSWALLRAVAAHLFFAATAVPLTPRCRQLCTNFWDTQSQLGHVRSRQPICSFGALSPLQILSGMSSFPPRQVDLFLFLRFALQSNGDNVKKKLQRLNVFLGPPSPLQPKHAT